jgi:predicted AlkP superfamily pyrophosphatase or phosphodiesterase
MTDTRSRAFMNSTRRASILAAALLGAAPGAQNPLPNQPSRPRLLVLVVVDQFRGDYPDLYGAQWTRGLKRLWTSGAVFPDAAYSFGRTTTCGGHATISTGTLPSKHGIIDNQWWDRAAATTVLCTDDPAAKPIGVVAPASGTHGPVLLRVPSLGEALQGAAAASRTIVITQKVRSSVMLAGRASPRTLSLWFEGNGSWSTSSAYATPGPEVADYLRQHPVSEASSDAWTKLLPLDAYRFGDAAPGELKPGLFPYSLRSPTGKTDSTFYNLWNRSPWSDAYVADFGAGLVETIRLGQGGATDLLGLGFSTLDAIGHDYGPHSHEVQDVLARLDVTLGRFLDALDRLVGRDGYVLAFSADHGVSPLPEQGSIHGFDGGRMGSSEVRQVIEATLSKVLGRGAYVPAVYGTNVYLADGVAERLLTQRPEAVAAVDAALTALRGVHTVYWRSALTATTPTDDANLAALRRSYDPTRGADLIVLPKPYWLFRPDDADHGTPHGYDTRVPLVLYGAAVKPGRYPGAAAPEDIAPTLARVVGITLPHADGRVLREAIR